MSAVMAGSMGRGSRDRSKARTRHAPMSRAVNMFSTQAPGNKVKRWMTCPSASRQTAKARGQGTVAGGSAVHW